MGPGAPCPRRSPPTSLGAPSSSKPFARARPSSPRRSAPRSRWAAGSGPSINSGGSRRSAGPGRLPGRSSRSPRGLAGALDLAGLEAARADVQALGCAVHERADALHVGVPPLGGAAVRVGDLHAEERLLPADVADGGHGPTRVTDALCRIGLHREADLQTVAK